MRLLSFLGALLVAIPAAAQAPAAKSPTDIVPSTAFGFVSIRVSDLRDVEALKPIREAIARFEKTEGGLEKQLGLPLDEIDRLTLFWPAAPDSEVGLAPYIAYTTRTPFNEAKLLKATKAVPINEAIRRGRHFEHGHHDVPAFPVPRRLAPPPESGPKEPLGPAPKGAGAPPSKDEFPPPKGFGEEGAQVGDPPAKPVQPVRADQDDAANEGSDLFFREHPVYSTIYLLDNRTILLMPNVRDNPIGLMNLVGQLLRKKNDGPLADALADAGKHTIVAAARVRPIQDLLQRERDFPRELVPYRSLMKAQTAVVTLDVGAKLATLSAKLAFADAATAARAEPVLKTLIQNGIEAMTELKKDQSKGAEWNAVLNPLLELACAALDKSEVKVDGRLLSAKVEAEIGPAITKALAALPELLEIAASKQKTLNNLKQIGLACHSYHDTMNFMPANIVGPDGKVLMSWRVAILPYIEQDNMYRQLDMTKAWDDPRNAKILEKMPEVFRVFGREADKGKTHFQMPSSPQAVPGGSPFLVPGRRTTFAHITDGTSNTFMVVEATDAVNWAKPDDLLFDPTKTPKVGAQGQKWFFALMGDGSVRTVRREKLTDNDLKAWFTIDGGEVVKD